MRLQQFDAARQQRVGFAPVGLRAPAILSFRGRALTLAGNLEAALADLNEGLVTESSAAAVPYAISFWASALLDRGRYDEAGAVLASVGLPDASARATSASDSASSDAMRSASWPRRSTPCLTGCPR